MALCSHCWQNLTTARNYPQDGAKNIQWNKILKVWSSSVIISFHHKCLQMKSGSFLDTNILYHTTFVQDIISKNCWVLGTKPKGQFLKNPSVFQQKYYVFSMKTQVKIFHFSVCKYSSRYGSKRVRWLHWPKQRDRAKNLVQRSWWSVHKLAQQYYKAGCRTRGRHQFHLNYRNGPYQANRKEIHRRQGPQEAAGHQGCP